MRVKSESEVAESYLTPSDPMDCSPPGSSVHGIFQARVLEGVPWPSPIHILAIVNNAGMNTGGHVSFQIMVFPR